MKNQDYGIVDFGDCYSIEKINNNNGEISHSSSKSIFVVYKKEGLELTIRMREFLSKMSMCIAKPPIMAKEKSNVKKGSTKSVVQPKGRREGSTSKK